jgi:hypothetical protein
MISATDPGFFTTYPNGAHVYDANGRRIYHVISSNPETGEVIRLPIFSGLFWQLHHRICEGFIWACGVRYPGDLSTAHGFHPAPLRIVPCAP